MIIKSEMIISGFVSKVVNEIVDVPLNPIKKAIRNADKNRKDKNQNIETRIYQVTIDALNEFTKNKFEGSDVLYDTAESVIKGFKTDKNSNLEAVRTGLNMLVSQVTSDTCEDFLKTLGDEICKDKNNVLYKEIVMDLQKQINKNIQKGFKENIQGHEETHKKLDYVIGSIDNINEKIYEKEKYKTKNYKITIKNRAEEYAKKWKENVFLNNYNEEDENAGVNIKLKDIYLEEHLPHYIWKENTKPSDKLKTLLKKYTIDNDDKKMLLILGQPGIGKSTFITWIVANLVEKKEDIYVYQFASDLGQIDWQGENILQSIFETLNLKADKLENKVLIIDGFDEIHASSDRKRILNQIYYKLKGMNYLKQFSLIITCRKNYIHELQRVECHYITLQTWDEEQIRSFCATYGNISKNPVPQDSINNILNNKEILGIPLILYMVLALNISIKENNSLVDIYDQIFSLDGGIYDRCINNLSYGEEHRISRIKKQIHQVSQKIAFWMFENEADKAVITKDKYEEICDSLLNETSNKNENIKRDVLISNYFEPIKHCEGIGTDELQFVHRSIYEYFVAVYFFESLHNLQAKEESAGKLGELLKYGQLSNQILEFIKYKFHGFKKYNLTEVIREAFNIMLKEGMTYYIGVPCKNAIQRESNIFSNILEILGLLKLSLRGFGNSIIIYLQYNRKKGLYLFEADLRGADLSRAYLIGADLSGADLRGADLSGADLIGADLSGADLSGARLIGADLSGADLSGARLIGADLSGADLIRADLIGADLIGVDLSGADLSGVDLSGARLSGADLSGADLSKTIFDENQVNLFCQKYDFTNSRVYISEAGETISYKEYCMGKQ